jgi:hypothetical protein
VLSYLACPAQGVDLTDADCTRRLVRTFVLPGDRLESAGAGKIDHTIRVTRSGRSKGGEAS